MHSDSILFGCPLSPCYFTFSCRYSAKVWRNPIAWDVPLITAKTVSTLWHILQSLQFEHQSHQFNDVSSKFQIWYKKVLRLQMIAASHPHLKCLCVCLCRLFHRPIVHRNQYLSCWTCWTCWMLWMWTSREVVATCTHHTIPNMYISTSCLCSIDIHVRTWGVESRSLL